MAQNKEAIAIVLDIGPGMAQGDDGQSTFLQTSIDAISMIVQRKMFSESKDEVALVLFGTDVTANALASTGCYEHISLARPLGLADWQLLQFMQNDVRLSDTSADFLDAIVVAMDHLMNTIQGKKGFGSKRLILFSNLDGEFGDDHLTDIIGSMKEADIEFNVIGPNLDDDDDGADHRGRGSGEGGASNGAKPRSAQQEAGRTLLRHILETVNGESYSFSEALPALSYFQSRQVRSTAWKCPMEIGANLQIPICLYTRIKEAKPKSFKNVYAKDIDARTERLRTYHLNDDEETEVEKTDTVEGHRYGSTLVPFSEEDKEALKYKTTKCFKVLGFTKSENIKKHQVMADSTWVCVAEPLDEAANVALSAIINALYETNMVAIVRRVYAANGAVKIGCLAPHIKTTYECLIYNDLPFAEDLRQFTFGSLPVGESSAVINKKFVPTDEQLSLMDDLIDNMDLSTCDRNEDGQAKEALKPKLTFNPHLQRLYQCLQHRALNPDTGLPQLSPVVAHSIEPPAQVLARCQATLDNISKSFKLQPVAKKETVTAQNIFKDTADAGPAAKKLKTETPAADLTVGLAAMVQSKVTEVGSTTPIEDFRAIIAQKDDGRFVEAHKMMQTRIVQCIDDSFGVKSYDKALDCLRELRTQSIQHSQSRLFNDFLLELKTTLIVKGRANFLPLLVIAKLSLITTADSPDSSVSADDADTFLKSLTATTDVKPTTTAVADTDNLLDEME